jgi:hypothetical protein
MCLIGGCYGKKQVEDEKQVEDDFNVRESEVEAQILSYEEVSDLYNEICANQNELSAKIYMEESEILDHENIEYAEYTKEQTVGSLAKMTLHTVYQHDSVYDTEKIIVVWVDIDVSEGVEVYPYLYNVIDSDNLENDERNIVMYIFGYTISLDGTKIALNEDNLKALSYELQSDGRYQKALQIWMALDSIFEN